MPRLKYYKNYEQFDEQRETPNLGEESSSEGINYQEQKGWWSNANIIASLSEAKIKAAIENYKTIISLLQIELLARKQNSPRLTCKLNFENWKVAPQTLGIRKKDRKGTKRLVAILKESGLSEVKIKELVELWQQSVSGKQL